MLGLKFGRWVHVSIAGGSLTLGGCVDRAYDFGDSGSFDPGDPDDPNDPNDPSDPDPTAEPPVPDPPPVPPGIPGPPALLDAQFSDNLTLQLTFTEPLAPAEAVDPRQFRLSTAITDDQGYGFEGTVYQEVGQLNGYGNCEEYCYEYCDYDYCYEECNDYCYNPPGPPVRVIAITQIPERPEMMWLTLDNGITPNLCERLEDGGNNFPEELTADLYIHYLAAGAAPVTDSEGELLPPLAEHWVLIPDEEFTYVEGKLPFMNPRLPIPCPF